MKNQRLLIVLIWLFSVHVLADEYPRFDGRKYNGLYYPRINTVEWADKESEPLHLQFQIYQKNSPVDVSGYTVEANGKNIFIAAIDINDRGERLCRRYVAPPAFKPNKKLYYYYDGSDRDMNNIIVSAYPMENKKVYTPKAIANCMEIKAYTSPLDPLSTQIANEGSVDSQDSIKEPGASIARAPASIDVNGPEINLDHKKVFLEPDVDFSQQEYYEPIPNNFNMYSF